MQIPFLWIADYIEQLPENSPGRIAITDMIIAYKKERERNADHVQVAYTKASDAVDAAERA